MKGLKTVYKTYNSIKPAKQGWGGGGGGCLLLSITSQDPVAVILIIIWSSDKLNNQYRIFIKANVYLFKYRKWEKAHLK